MRRLKGSAGPALAAGGAAFVLHVPFLARWDLHFQPDFAVSVLMSRAILDGERPVFFWGQDFLGSAGNYVTAAVFAVAGARMEAACLVSLSVWALGVVLTAALARRLLPAAGAWWAAAAAAVASPYALHYVTQPYSSYETAPVLAILVLAAMPRVARLVRGPLEGRAAAAWVVLGAGLGAALWTTRLFVPALAAAVLAGLLRGRWDAARARRLAAGCVLAALGLAAGAGPELWFRLRGAGTAPLEQRALLGVAAPADVPRRAALALRALPAYLNGDPLARRPEGATFAAAVLAGRPPYAAARHRPGPLARAHDALVRAALLGVAAATLATLVAAWRTRRLGLLALCLTPLVHVALLALSEQSAHYFAARRYWFGSLLVLALLVGNAMAWAERARSAAARWGARAVAATLLVASLASQARLLTLPDELADHRAVVADLRAHGVRAVIGSELSWILAGLGLGTIDVYDHRCLRRPPMCERVLASRRIALVRPGGDPLPDGFAIGDAAFTATPEPPRRRGALSWRLYARRGASPRPPPARGAT